MGVLNFEEDDEKSTVDTGAEASNSTLVKAVASLQMAVEALRYRLLNLGLE